MEAIYAWYNSIVAPEYAFVPQVDIPARHPFRLNFRGQQDISSHRPAALFAVLQLTTETSTASTFLPCIVVHRILCLANAAWGQSPMNIALACVREMFSGVSISHLVLVSVHRSV